MPNKFNALMKGIYIMGDDYKTYTVQDIVNIIKKNPESFPNGMKTKIFSGDFEGNTYHKKHSIMKDGKSIFLGFELHESEFF